MPVLIVEHEGQCRGARLPRRVLIGRRATNHLVINHRLVSRMHAWIDCDGGRCFLTDTGTRTGTTVNGIPLASRYELVDGDEIVIGPARLTFLGGEAVPEHAAEFVIPDAPPPVADDNEKGVLFECACGAPMWAGLDHAGHQGQCRYCGRSLKVPWPNQDGSHAAGAIPFAPDGERPRRAKPTAQRGAKFVLKAEANTTPGRPPHAPRVGGTPPRVTEAVQARRAAAEARADALLVPVVTPVATVAEPATSPATCGVCQSSIATFEESTTCPSCGLSFHAECWNENYGCSAYGCSQVNVLAPAQEPAHGGAGPQADEMAAAETMDEAGPDGRSGQVPWEFVLLAASVFSALLGAITFGVPSLIVVAGSLAFVARNRRKGGGRNGVVLVSAGLGVLGLVGGVAVSYLFYFGRGLPR
jgi:FHA domain